MLLSRTSDPYQIMFPEVFIFLTPLSSGLSWKILLIHRWSTLWWNFVFLSCEFGADRSFPAPWWDLLTNPLAAELSVTSRWCFWDSSWYLSRNHRAQWKSTDEDMEVRLCHCPLQSQRDLERMTDWSLHCGLPIQDTTVATSNRESGEWVSSVKLPAEALGKKLPKGTLLVN